MRSSEMVAAGGDGSGVDFCQSSGVGEGEAQESTLSWKEVRSDLTVQ